MNQVINFHSRLPVIISSLNFRPKRFTLAGWTKKEKAEMQRAKRKFKKENYGEGFGSKPEIPDRYNRYNLTKNKRIFSN